MKKILLVSTCLVMTACTTTKPAVEKSAADINVRPVMETGQAKAQPEFNVDTAMAKARRHHKAANYAKSHEAYKIILTQKGLVQDVRNEALLGMADSALALTWHDEKYAIAARDIYTEIVWNADSTEMEITRAKAGLLLLDLADFTPGAAKKRLQAALRNNPDDPRLWNALGRVHDGNKDWLAALDAYVKALAAARKNNTGTAAVVNNMGMSLLMQGRKKEALKKFRQARKANPDMPVYDNNLRLAQILSGETDKAIKGLSDIRTAQIYNDAGVIAETRNNKRKAAALYKKAIETSPVYFELAEKNLAALTGKVQLTAGLN